MSKKIIVFAKVFNSIAITFLFAAILFGCANKEVEDQTAQVKEIFNRIEELAPESEEFKVLADSAYNISNRINYRKGATKATWLQGKYLYAETNYEAAKSKFETSLRNAKEINDLKLIGDVYENLGFVYNRFKDINKSTEYLKLSAKVRGEIGDSVGMGVSYNNTGFIFWMASQYDSAIIYFEKALELRENLPQKEFLASTCNNIGTVYYNWSIYDKALEYYLRALAIQKELGNDQSVAITLTNIGLVYDETSQTQKAFEYYKESLPYAISAGDSQTIGYVYNSIASAFVPINIDSAAYYYKKSLDFYKSVNYVGGEILALKGLGNIEEQKNNFSAAKDYYYRILRLAEDQGIRIRIAEIYLLLGKVYLYETNLQIAKNFFLKSIEIAEEISLKNYPRDGFLYLSEIYDKTGNVDSAYAAFKQYEKYNSEINDADMQRRLSDLKSSFELERYKRSVQAQIYKNEKQRIYLVITIVGLLFLAFTAVILFRSLSKIKRINNLLVQKNELIEGQKSELNYKNEELTESNVAKDKLFSIIAHDLKSPFNTLLNFSAFLREDYFELTDDERLDYIKELEGTTKNTYELLENLLFLSASRTGRLDFNPSAINLKEMIDSVLELYASQTKGKSITIKNNISCAIKVFADSNMLKIVLRNLLSNAVKYCDDNGEITLNAELKNERVIISVEDNGIGMDDATQTNIFNINVVRSKMGTGGEKGTGLGLGLCKEFIEQHKGKISVESEKGKGSKFSFYLPQN